MERCVVLKNHNDSNAFCSNNLVPNLIQKLEPVQVAFLIVRFRRKKAQEKHPSTKRKTMREAKVTKKGKGKTPKREGLKWDSRCMVEKPAGCVLDIFGHNFRLSTEVARSTLLSSHCCTQRFSQAHILKKYVSMRSMPAKIVIYKAFESHSSKKCSKCRKLPSDESVYRF